ncbi:hypothetical protein ES703_58578 [subsurface metagenome]
MAIEREVIAGDRFPVGDICPQGGRYRHTACDNLEIYYKGTVFVTCSNQDCPRKFAEWEFWEKMDLG